MRCRRSESESTRYPTIWQCASRASSHTPHIRRAIAPMSSGDWFWGLVSVLVVGEKGLVIAAGDAAFEAAPGCGLGFADGDQSLVVGVALAAVHTGLGDG